MRRRASYAQSVAAADINRLDIDTLDSAGIAALIAAGEIVVERKEKPPRKGLAPSVAAYANSGGGWLLVGVSNAGKAVGWQ
jgi:predicted HTH transcriptional regulator